jgi:hypothetical protein
VLDVEERLGAIDRERFDLVDIALALVIAAPGVAFGILVSENRPGRLQHRFRNVIIRPDQPDRIDLVALFLFYEVKNFRISSLEFVHTAPPLPLFDEPTVAPATRQNWERVVI